MTLPNLLAILIGIVIILLGWILYWIAAIYFTIRKGLNELIEGLASVDADVKRAIEQRKTPGG